MARKGSSKPTKSSGQGWSKVTVAAIDVFGRLVDRFGWPGVFLIAAFWFVDKYGTKAQKEEIISTFLLGRGIKTAYPLIALGIVFLLVCLAQHIYWKRRVAVMDSEIDRLSQWKSGHQEKEIGAPLHHSS